MNCLINRSFLLRSVCADELCENWRNIDSNLYHIDDNYRLADRASSQPNLVTSPDDDGLSCYCCGSVFRAQLMRTIIGPHLDRKKGLAILRRQTLNKTPLTIKPNSRLCHNCNQYVLQQVAQKNTKVLNVVTNPGQDKCFICQGTEDLLELPFKAVLKIFVESSKFVSGRIRACQYHLLPDRTLPPAFYDNIATSYRQVTLSPNACMLWVYSLQQEATTALKHAFEDETKMSGEEFQVFTGISKIDFLDMFDRIKEARYLRHMCHKKDLLCLLVKLHQGLSDDFLSVLFKYNTRQQVGQIITYFHILYIIIIIK